MHESARPCGCDLGCKPAPHYCEWHRSEQEEAVSKDASKGGDAVVGERTEVGGAGESISLAEVKAFRDARYRASTAIIDKKGADYNREQQEAGDTLFNLRVCALLGIVPSTEEGILVRLSDKFMRLISLTKPGREAAVSNESVLDTIDDVHNYIDYLGLVWMKRQRESAELRLLTTLSGCGTNYAAP